jgi:hypothetical protein
MIFESLNNIKKINLNFAGIFAGYIVIVVLAFFIRCNDKKIIRIPKTNLLPLDEEKNDLDSIKNFIEKIKTANKPVNYFYGKFSLNAKMDKKKQNAIGEIWVDNRMNRIKFILRDPVFLSKINTIVIIGNQAEIFDHVRSDKFKLPTYYLRLENIMGESLSFASFQPLIQNRLPMEIWNENLAHYFPRKQRIYINARMFEAVYDFKYSLLARLVFREKYKQKKSTENKKIFIFFQKRKKLNGFSFPWMIVIRDDSKKEYVEIKFTKIKILKNIKNTEFTLK